MFEKFFPLISIKLEIISFNLSSLIKDKLFFWDGSSLRLYSMKFNELPSSILTFFETSGPLYGGIITQSPFLKAVLVEASIISSSLPLPLLLIKSWEKSFPSIDWYFDPTKTEIELNKSTWDIISLETPGLIFPFQYVIKGTLVPASKRLYLPPLSPPDGVWSPSFSTASS